MYNANIGEPLYQKTLFQNTMLFNIPCFGFVDVTFVYCSPKHIIISKQFEAFFVMLGDRFTAVSDYNQQTSIQDPD